MYILSGFYKGVIAALMLVILSFAFSGSIYASEEEVDSQESCPLNELINSIYMKDDREREAGLKKLNDYMQSGGSPNDIVHVPYSIVKNITLYQRVLMLGDYEMIKLMVDFGADPNQQYF